MATKKTNAAKFTAWDKDGARVEASGSIGACAVWLFGCVHGAAEREAVLLRMQQRHARLAEAGV